MKRFGLAVTVVCVAALGVTGIATANGGYGNDRDWVVGAIKRTSLDGTLDQHFTIAAFETRNGADGIYIAKYRAPDGRTWGYTARVTCINVVGRNAMVGIQVLRSTDSSLSAGQGHFLRITDYGGPNVVGQRDSVSPSSPNLSSGPTVCPAPVTEVTPTYAGNLIVHDGDL